MNYLIKIKRDTIRKNPNAGRQSYSIPGHTTAILEKYIVIDGILHYQKLVVTSLEIEYDDNPVKHVVVKNVKNPYIIEERLVEWETTLEIFLSEPVFNLPTELLFALRKGDLTEVAINIVMSRSIHQVRTMTPEASHLFEWENTQVQCDECGAQFSYRDLKSDAMPDEDDEIWSNKICPKCGHWGCCELEYEKLEDANVEKI